MLADISSTEGECSTECSSCSVLKQENWQLKNTLSMSKEEIRQLKNKLKTSKDNLQSRRKEQKKWQRKGIVQANDYIWLGYKAYDFFFALCVMVIFFKGHAKNIHVFVIQGLFLVIFKIPFEKNYHHCYCHYYY